MSVVKAMEQFCSSCITFPYHPACEEDLINAPQRPKMELFNHQQLLIAHSVPAPGRDMRQPHHFDKQVC